MLLFLISVLEVLRLKETFMINKVNNEKYLAMENWGLITYRESRLLFDVTKSSQLAEQAIVEVIAHELAHMW
jgi:aminopeptidase N